MDVHTWLLGLAVSMVVFNVAIVLMLLGIIVELADIQSKLEEDGYDEDEEGETT